MRCAVVLFLPVIVSFGLASLSVAVKPSGLACEGCHGVVTELQEKLIKPAKASFAERAPALLKKICKLENLVRYVYSPPKMIKACNELLDEHRSAIAESLIRHFNENPSISVAELEADICFEIAGSCKGIKDSPAAEVSDKVVADQILKPGAEGKITIDPLGKKTEDKQDPKTKSKTQEPAAGNKKAKTKPPVTAQDADGTPESIRKDKGSHDQFFGFKADTNPSKAKPAQKTEL